MSNEEMIAAAAQPHDTTPESTPSSSYHVDEDMRVICKEAFHNGNTFFVATFRREPVYNNGVEYHMWTWREELAWGGGTVDLITGQREYFDRVPTTPEQQDAGAGDYEDIPVKHFIDHPEHSRYDLQCRCGLRKRVQIWKLDQIFDAWRERGRNEVLLRDLVANVK